MIQPSFGATIQFVALVLFLFVYLCNSLFRAEYRRTKRQDVALSLALWIAVGLFAWLFLTASVAFRGVLSEWDARPPRIFFVIVPVFVTFLFLGSRRRMLLILDQIKLSTLVRIQGFRLFMEWILWLLVQERVMPEIMTFTGRNFDVVVGATALVVAKVVKNNEPQHRRLIAFWNLCGILILLNTVVHAILSAPTPFRVFWTDPPNWVVATFPFVWLPAFVVPFAFFFHFLTILKLRRLK